jgi:hypothetical protein
LGAVLHLVRGRAREDGMAEPLVAESLGEGCRMGFGDYYGCRLCCREGTRP